MKVRVVQADLVNTGSSCKKRLQIPSDLVNKLRKERLIYISGSMAIRGGSASSFLSIQASLDYLHSENVFKSVGNKIRPAASLP
jgi:hypothetical protein